MEQDPQGMVAMPTGARMGSFAVQLLRSGFA
jgi:hypothetical protein